MTNKQGLTLHFGQAAPHKKPIAHIVYVMGLSEFSEKTYELARDFNRESFNFSSLDRVGQGRSDRPLADREKQHSTGVHHDVDDLIQYCKENIPEGEPIVLLGHSTGGLIGALAMEKEPELFKAAIFTGPLWAFGNPIVKNREGFFSRLPMPQRVRESYSPGGGPWKARNAPDSTMKPSEFSSDKVRNKVHDYWKKSYPELRAGSPTYGWVNHMCKGIITLRNPNNLKNIKQPVLVFTGGKDTLVNNEAIEEIVKNLPNATQVHYKDGKHELLMEKDDIRSDLLYKVSIPFIKNNI